VDRLAEVARSLRAVPRLRSESSSRGRRTGRESEEGSRLDAGRLGEEPALRCCQSAPLPPRCSCFRPGQWPRSKDAGGPRPRGSRGQRTTVARLRPRICVCRPRPRARDLHLRSPPESRKTVRRTAAQPDFPARVSDWGRCAAARMLLPKRSRLSRRRQPPGHRPHAVSPTASVTSTDPCGSAMQDPVVSWLSGGAAETRNVIAPLRLWGAFIRPGVVLRGDRVLVDEAAEPVVHADRSG
jgi:hypothetical protein